MLSVIIPSRNEPFLRKTIEDVLVQARGDIEVIAVLDGWKTDLPDDPRVRSIYFEEPCGLRAGVNAAVAVARGEFIMKLDAHCMVGEGFDVILAESCEKNWIVIPRRKRLDADAWRPYEATPEKPDIDYEYFTFPDNPRAWGGPGLHPDKWTERTVSRLGNRDFDIDDNMTYQASAWFMPKAYFEFLDMMDEKSYVHSFNEGAEASLKCWLSGGRVVVNKKTWYAHLAKGKKHARGYFIDIRKLKRGNAFVNKWLTNSAGWNKQILPFEWLIEKFWPIPGWPEDWREKIRNVK